MSTDLPPQWAIDKTVPTSTITILGAGGNTVATLNVTGTATVTVAYPYRSTQTST